MLTPLNISWNKLLIVLEYLIDDAKQRIIRFCVSEPVQVLVRRFTKSAVATETRWEGSNVLLKRKYQSQR